MLYLDFMFHYYTRVYIPADIASPLDSTAHVHPHGYFITADVWRQASVDYIDTVVKFNNLSTVMFYLILDIINIIRNKKNKIINK